MKKILIFEDDQDIVDVTTIILEANGYEVSSFTNFAGYEKVLAEGCSDLVLLDLNLGGYSGKEICSYIKQRPDLNPLKVVLMSANLDICEVKEEVGADGFICKPFNITDFIDTIERCISGQ